MEALFERLAQYLTAQTGQTVTITDARPLAGGASRDTWMIATQSDAGTHRYVLRRDLPTQMFEEALSRAEEFAIMDAAHDAGVTVAKVRYLCTDPAVLESDFILMDYVEGISIGPKVIHAPDLATARERLPEQMARELAIIHQMPANQHGLSFLKGQPDGMTPAEQVIEQTLGILDQLEIHNPTWEWALRWAKQNAPQPDTITLIHGDFRIGNLLVDAQGLSAVIDWEFAHIGDPDEELGYVCMRDWRFGQGHLHFAGLSDRERFLTAYERISGRTVRRPAVDWWEVMGNIRWGVICMSQANRHLSGLEPSVELASLGRRSAEMQLETLRLIERIGF